MKYSLVLQGKNSYEVLDTKDTMELANKRLEKLSKKLKRTDIKIVGVPEVRAGLRLFRQGKYYKTILKETKTIWLLNNTEKPENQDDLARKSSKKNNDIIEGWILSGKLDGFIEEYDDKYIDNVYDGSEDDLEEMMDEIANDKDKIESEE